MVEKRRPLLSVVIPCFNEEQVIDATHCRLSEALALIDMNGEIIYVDDGSSDATEQRLRHIQATDCRVRALFLSRNFGHQFAVSAGIDYAAGDAVVLIDADLQDPPHVIAGMVEKWRQGYDVIYGTRTQRPGESAFKLATAKLFYRLLNWLSDTAVPLDTGDFRLMDRRVVDVLKAMPEHDRFLRGMVSWLGFRQLSLPYERAERFAGQSKYPLTKMLRLALDGMISFSNKPLRLAALAGCLSAALGALGSLAGLLALCQHGPVMPNWILPLSILTTLIGGQFVCLGILGEYIGRIYRSSKQRPLYVIRDRLTGDSEPNQNASQRHAA